jgi:hypothetical protein
MHPAHNDSFNNNWGEDRQLQKNVNKFKYGSKRYLLEDFDTMDVRRTNFFDCPRISKAKHEVYPRKRDENETILECQ